MRVKNTVSVPANISRCVADDFLRLIGMESPHEIYISTLDPESLGIVSRFNIRIPLNQFYKPCIDNDCIYLPSKTGQILVLDKFSGELIFTINLGSNYIMSDILQTQSHIFCVAAIPINTKLKLHLNRYCIFIFDKIDYRKLVQTSYFTGPPSFLSIDRGHLYAVGNENIYKFSINGELEAKTENISSDIPIVHTGTHVVCCDRHGEAKILDYNDFRLQSIVEGTEMESLPATTLDNKVLWFSKNGVCQIDIDKQVSSHFSSNSVFDSPKIVINEDYLFGCDQKGNVISFNLHNHSVQIIKLTNEKLRNPVMVDKYLFTLSDSKLHHIEVNK